MSRRYRILLVLLGVGALSLVLTAAALADAFSQVYTAYRKDGRVPPCRFSAAVLSQAKAQVPPDIDQYAPDFPAALDAALSQRAAGACGAHAATPAGAASGAAAGAGGAVGGGGVGGGGGGAAAGGAPVAAARPSAGATPTPVAATEAAAPASLAVAGHTRGHGGGTPAAIIALAVLAGLLALATGVWGLARWRGWDPPWVQYASHAVSEAGVHAEATWAEFADWVRLGR